MKIAIQGHKSRGHEVIQILESLGGKKRDDLTGRMFTQYYFINYNGDIDLNLKVNLFDYKFYTLEEFEKEFPFKIGDEIRDCSDNEIGTITDLLFIDNMLVYNVDFVNSGQAFMPTEQLKYHKEMQEERNITLTLEKAKEWYKKGGELKEIALQAFTDKELNPLPRSWEEFCKNNPIQDHEAFINYANGYITMCKECAGSGLGIWTRKPEKDRCKCVSQKSAEAHLAMMQLEQLRNCWWNGWEPIWDCSEKWCIRLWGNELGVGLATHISRFLTFPTNEMAREFLECFRDLIEKAKDLI